MSEAENHLTVDNSDETKECYVVQVATKAEQKIAAAIERRVKQFNLESSFGEIMVLTETLTGVRRGERVTVKNPILPGYVLIMINPKDKRAFELVRRTPGVLGFLSSSQHTGDPKTISAQELGSLQERAEGTAESPASSVTFEVGESVSIIEGAFDGWVGNIEEIEHENKRLKVLVPIFGRLTPLDLSYDQVKKDVD